MSQKLRVRNARYPDVHHIELMIQSQIEVSKYLKLPPILKPYILNFLNIHIARGEVYITVADGKLTGFALMHVTSFPWNPDYQIYSINMVHVSRSHPDYEEAGELLLREMVNHAERNGGALVYERQAAIPTNIPDEIFAKVLTYDGMSYCFQPEPAEMEFPQE